MGTVIRGADSTVSTVSNVGKLGNVSLWLVFALLSLAFFALEATHFRYSVSDENTYIYMAKAVSGGQLPYRDFFLAHPPLNILFLALVYAVFGFNLFVLKATSPLLIILAEAFMFKLVRDKAGGSEAVIAAALFYFSYDVLRFSTFATWISLSVALIVISIFFALNKRHIVAGVIMAAACLTGLFSLFGALAVMAYLFVADRKGLVKFAASFLAVFLAANIVLLLLFKGSYFESVYYYPLAGFALLFLFARSRLKHLFVLSGLMVASYAFALAFLLGKVFVYYFLPLIPCLAIIGAHGASGMAERAVNRRSQAVAFVAAAIMLSAAFSGYYFWSNSFQDFEGAEKIADYIKFNSIPSDTIFGDDSITPLLAMLSERKIAFNMIDSNSLRWRSGLLNINDTIAQIKQQRVRFVIERRLNDGRGSFIYGPAYIDRFKAFLHSDCITEANFSTAWGRYYKEYYIYDCRSG
ncbi:hypothetical protein HYV82_00410 [Candidatus Woesearchaeota archaeon]|nr:hypothetical protein [Candidatus Woesearchaeota archaeon]